LTSGDDTACPGVEQRRYAVLADDNTSPDRRRSLEGWAVVASFYALAFGVPSVTVAVKTLLP
jgi:hypothetical protein